MGNESWRERQEDYEIENVLASLHVVGTRGSPVVSQRFGRGRLPRRRTIAILLMAAMTGIMMIFAGNALGEPEAPGDENGGRSVLDADARDANRDAAQASARALPSPQAAAPSSVVRPPTTAPAPPSPTRAVPRTSAPSVPRTTPPRSPTARPTSAPPPPPAPPPPIRIDFATFDDVSGIALNGGAARNGSVLRITTADGPHAASAWSVTRIDPTKSFATTFRVLLHDVGADGLAFVVHNQGPGAIGGTGGGLGYGDYGQSDVRIPASVAVEFDVFDNSWEPDTDDNHIEVTTDGFVREALGFGVPDFRMWCDCEFNAWIDYDASTHTVRVFVSRNDTKPSEPVVSAQVDIGAVVGSRQAFVGFTAGMGFYVADQDVLSWHLVQPR